MTQPEAMCQTGGLLVFSSAAASTDWQHWHDCVGDTISIRYYYSVGDYLKATGMPRVDLSPGSLHNGVALLTSLQIDPAW